MGPLPSRESASAYSPPPLAVLRVGVTLVRPRETPTGPAALRKALRPSFHETVAFKFSSGMIPVKGWFPFKFLARW